MVRVQYPDFTMHVAISQPPPLQITRHMMNEFTLAEVVFLFVKKRRTIFAESKETPIGRGRHQSLAVWQVAESCDAIVDLNGISCEALPSVQHPLPDQASVVARRGVLATGMDRRFFELSHMRFFQGRQGLNTLIFANLPGTSAPITITGHRKPSIVAES